MASGYASNQPLINAQSLSLGQWEYARATWALASHLEAMLQCGLTLSYQVSLKCVRTCVCSNVLGSPLSQILRLTEKYNKLHKMSKSHRCAVPLIRKWSNQTSFSLFLLFSLFSRKPSRQSGSKTRRPHPVSQWTWHEVELTLQSLYICA